MKERIKTNYNYQTILGWFFVTNTSLLRRRTMNYAEYEICKKRGHTSTGIGMSVGNTIKSTCKHCGTVYYFTDPQLVEERRPEPNDNDSSFTAIPN
jgi:hypothetical protein